MMARRTAEIQNGG